MTETSTPTRSKVGQSSLAAIKAILGTTELRTGPHSAAPADEFLRDLSGNEVPECILCAFRLVSLGVWHRRFDDLIILANYEDGLPEYIEHVAARLKSQSFETISLTCVVANHATPLEAHPTLGALSWSSADDFLRMLVSLPESFEAQLYSAANVRDANFFAIAKQQRTARIVSLPRGTQAKSRRGEVDLDAYIREWLASPLSPGATLLLGDRGTGKSWELLHVALQACRLHREHPDRFGPAIFVSLRQLVNVIEAASAATPLLHAYLQRNYSGLDFPFGGISMLGALLSSGYAIVCLDGFDEMDQFPTDERVQARLTTVLLMLSKKTRFIMTSRSGHFASLGALLSLHGWSGSTVGETFSVLHLLPLNQPQRDSYIRAVATTPVAENLISISGPRNDGLSLEDDPLRLALSVCTSHPGLLAHITAAAASSVTAPLAIIEDAMLTILIEFNLVEDRTRESLLLPSGGRVLLDAGRRIRLLSELAWYMAERGSDSISLSDIPARLQLAYGISGDALQRDLREQTVLESATGLGSESDRAPSLAEPGASSQLAAPALVQQETARDSIAGKSEKVRFTLRTGALDGQSVGESSVAGAYFLATYIMDKLREDGPFGPTPLEHRLRYLGQVALGPLSAAMLKAMLGHHGSSPRDIGIEAWRHLRGVAARRRFEVFCPRYRHLAANLQAIGALTEAESDLLRPWAPSLEPVLRGPSRAPEYPLALVPAQPRDQEGENALPPFLLGVHEVTNRLYQRFVNSEPTEVDEDHTIWGREWSVTRITAAGSGGRTPPSENAPLTNEYHLFVWLPNNQPDQAPSETPGVAPAGTLAYAPPEMILSHPVTYVSWWAAAAYADWLSRGEGGRHRSYRQDFLRTLRGTDLQETSGENSPLPGYRLPSRSEWTWAARGGHLDLESPWMMFPYYLAPEERERQPSNEEALRLYREEQENMKRILVRPGKDSQPVLYDEINDFGFSGLVGNVREWCDDRLSSGREAATLPGGMRFVIGATGYLGPQTFNFQYGAELYPRNTNPDVGFRVARSLAPEELEALQSRELQIEALPGLS